MSVLQFRCNECSSVFECLVSSFDGSGLKEEEIVCISCGAKDFLRLEESPFFPKKSFCPRGTGCRRAA